jgi:hypothetical protein
MAEKRTGGGRRKASQDDPGEQLKGPERRTALIQGDMFGIKGVVYTVVDDLAIFEGDIVLGTVEEVEAQNAQLREVMMGGVASGVAITGANFRWPNCTIPFDIDSNLPDQNRVTQAIAHWEANTRYRFVARTSSHADFVTFRPGTGCSASVGRRGNQQFVNLAPGCGLGQCIHEIGHVVGLWHEQSREDRDAFVTIHFDKIQPGFEHNFDQHITDGDDIGPYDYGSIMHYPRDAFSVDGSDTITPVDPNAQIGQRTALSQGDIAAANSLCPKIRKELVKDNIKDVAKDPIRDGGGKLPFRDTFKEIPKDPIADTVKETVVDTIKEAATDPIKGLRDVGPLGPIRTGPITGPLTGRLPFAVATGHQAPGAADPAADIQALDQHLQQLAALMDQNATQGAALQAQYDEAAAALAAAIQAAGGMGG